jgi:hypothetical protein
MPRYRVPIVIRALALFLASLPVARAGMAGATNAQGMGTLPAREAHVPVGALWIRPAPQVIAVSAVGAAVAGVMITQRTRPPDVTPVQAMQQGVRATARSAAQLPRIAPVWQMLVPVLTGLLAPVGRGRVPVLFPYLSTTIRARAP